MNLLIGGIIATASVIALGLAMLVPTFIPEPSPPPIGLIFISVVEDTPDIERLCSETADYFMTQQIPVTVFFSGIVAENHPNCVRVFAATNITDIGISTYNYTAWPAINDYSNQLQQIQKAKTIVDGVAGINARSFKAPYNTTDDDIYSLLSRNGILADFSYDGHYNIYDGEQFIWTDYQAGTLVLNVDLDSEIQARLQATEQQDVEWHNASMLTGVELTKP